MSINNAIFLSGVHGSGKSTLAKELSKLGLYLYDSPHHKVLEDTVERLMWRVEKYSLETKDILFLPSHHQVLADRCIYDNHAYGLGFYRIDWINREQFNAHEELSQQFFHDGNLPQNIIYLRPRLEFVKKNLRRRWETEPKKWREDNFVYLESVHSAFDDVYSEVDANILILEGEALEERVGVVKEWMKELRLM